MGAIKHFVVTNCEEERVVLIITETKKEGALIAMYVFSGIVTSN